MALNPDLYFGVTDNPTIEISQENFRSVAGQIENELLCTDTYSHALATLQTMLGEAASAAEILIRAVSREAVKLAFQRFPKQNKTQLQVARESFVAENSAASAVTELKPPLAAPVFYQSQAVLEAPPKTEPQTESLNRNIEPSPESEKSPTQEGQEFVEQPQTESQQATEIRGKIFPGFGFLKPQKRLSKEEKTALAIQHREECLRQLGRELRRGRQTRYLSIQQLHNQTFVPLHHLEALENGDIETLPQDIYVRGFIRRIGDALGLDGTAMANSLPEPEPSEIVIPSFLIQESESESNLQLRPAHLYLGYTALMAGAVGGLAWLSQQPTVPGAQAETEVTPPPSVTPVQQREAPAPQPGVKKSSSHGGTIVGSDMAPPEVIFG